MTKPRKTEPRNHDDVEAKILPKTVLFEEDLHNRVEAFQKKLRYRSFSGACINLIEAALETTSSPSGTSDIRLNELPVWLQSAIREASKHTGLEYKAVIVDLLGRHVQEYVERARNLESSMTNALKPSK